MDQLAYRRRCEAGALGPSVPQILPKWALESRLERELGMPSFLSQLGATFSARIQKDGFDRQRREGFQRSDDCA